MFPYLTDHIQVFAFLVSDFQGQKDETFKDWPREFLRIANYCRLGFILFVSRLGQKIQMEQTFFGLQTIMDIIRKILFRASRVANLSPSWLELVFEILKEPTVYIENRPDWIVRAKLTKIIGKRLSQQKRFSCLMTFSLCEFVTNYQYSIIT